MSLREGAERFLKKIVGTPTPDQQRVRTDLPIEPLAGLTTHIPNGPSEEVKPPTPDGGLPVKKPAA